MSADILAAPHLNVRFTREVQEDGGEGEENQVEILDEEEHLGSEKARPHAPKNPAVVKRRYLKAAAVTLGGMYLLILAGIFIRYISTSFDKHRLSNDYEKLSNRYEKLHTAYEELNSQCGIKGYSEGWKRFGCSCYYKSNEMKNWTESRKYCQDNGADLVTINNKEEQEFLWKLNEHGDSWVGLQSVKTNKEWKQNFDWEWVDTSRSTYMAWRIDVDVSPQEGSTGYIDLEGSLQHTNNGTKQWICEKQM